MRTAPEPAPAVRFRTWRTAARIGCGDGAKRMELGKAIYTQAKPTIKDGKFILVTDEFEVRIIVIAEKYAMVRRKGCMPFACSIADLKQQL